MELCKRDHQKEVCESLAWQNKYLGDNDRIRRCLIICCFFIMTLCGCSKSVDQQITEQLKLGQRYLLEQNYEEAIIAFHRGIELDAKNMEAYQGLELAYEEAENYKEALDIQEILISFEPGKQENEIKLIELMAKNGDIEGALE